MSWWRKTNILKQYRQLLSQVDRWFSSCQAQYPDHIACGRGCSACCRGLFDITLLDAALLRAGYALLPDSIRTAVAQKAEARMTGIRNVWPEFAPPYLLNSRPEEEWPQIMPDDDETPCVLLDSGGLCLLYDYRPLTCRLHGLPHIDRSGAILDDDWCTLNFTGADPRSLSGLSGDFAEIFRKESHLIGAFNLQVTGTSTAQLDTLIPAALLVAWTKQTP